MLYRIAHAINAWYALAVAWVYIGAFALALGLLFVFPQVTLLMFFLGLASLGFAVMLGWIIDSVARGMARRAVNAGRCPRCSRGGQSAKEPDTSWTCEHCAAEFALDGAEIDPRDRERWVTTEGEG